jgi:hypothetical protein
MRAEPPSSSSGYSGNFPWASLLIIRNHNFSNNCSEQTWKKSIMLISWKLNPHVLRYQSNPHVLLYQSGVPVRILLGN